MEPCDVLSRSSPADACPCFHRLSGAIAKAWEILCFDFALPANSAGDAALDFDAGEARSSSIVSSAPRRLQILFCRWTC